MNLAELTDGELGVYSAPSKPYVLVNGTKVLKVKEPYYCKDKKIISAFCPHCGLELDRVWNLDYCGSCGGRVSWHEISVKDYGDIP